MGACGRLGEPSLVIRHSDFQPRQNYFPMRSRKSLHEIIHGVGRVPYIAQRGQFGIARGIAGGIGELFGR